MKEKKKDSAGADSTRNDKMSKGGRGYKHKTVTSSAVQGGKRGNTFQKHNARQRGGVGGSQNHRSMVGGST